MAHLLFVYGTLKKGKCNHHVLGTNAKFLGTGTVVGFDLFSNGYYPYAVLTNSNHKCISGEVYEIDDEAFAMCDRLEGYPNHYLRKKVNVDLGTLIHSPYHRTAWIYYTEQHRLNTTNLQYLDKGVFE